MILMELNIRESGDFELRKSHLKCCLNVLKIVSYRKLTRRALSITHSITHKMSPDHIIIQANIVLYFITTGGRNVFAIACQGIILGYKKYTVNRSEAKVKPKSEALIHEGPDDVHFSISVKKQQPAVYVSICESKLMPDADADAPDAQIQNILSGLSFVCFLPTYDLIKP